MNLTYQVISTEEGKTTVKFFYKEDKKYGEFYIYFDRFTKNIKNEKSELGVYGEAVLEPKHIEYASNLLAGLSKTLLGINKCSVCAKEFVPDRCKDTCNFCFEEIQNDHMGDIK